MAIFKHPYFNLLFFVQLIVFSAGIFLLTQAQVRCYR